MQHFIPALRSDLIERRRLLDLLAGWRSARLIRVVAPAGFGKTMLAAAWLAQLAQSDAPASAWISLDEDAIPADVFLTQLLEALAPHLAASGDLRALAAAGQLSPAHGVATVVRRLAARTQPVVLVVDDLQRLSPAALALLQPLLDADWLPLVLLLLSRTAPALDDSVLRVRDACISIDAQQMRVDHEEFCAFVQRTPRNELDVAQLSDLERRADGWFAAIQLLLPAPDDARAIDAYLERQVLRAHPPAALEFLAAVSFLPVLTAPLCAAALDRSPDECTRLLRDAAAADGLLQPLRTAARHEAWRMHPLLRDALRLRIDAAAQAAARSRAAQHIAADGDVDGALACLSPEQRRDAVDIVVPAIRPALLRFDLLAARRWLATLPPDAPASHPQLALDAAWMEYFSDDAAALRTCIERARAALAADGSPAALRTELHTLDALCAWFEGDAERARRLRDAIEDAPPSNEGLAGAYLAMFDGYLPRDPSRVQLRIRAFQRAGDIFQHIGYAHGVVEAAATQGFVKWRYANADGAVASLSHALAVMQATGWENSPAAADAAFACGELLYHMDRLTEARTMLQRSLAAADAHGIPTAITSLAALALQLCDAQPSAVRAGEEEEIADERRWVDALTSYVPTVVGMIAALRILRDARRGRPERCWLTVENMRLLPGDLQPTHPDFTWYAVLSGAVCGGRADDETAAVLAQFRTRMHEEHNDWMTLRADILLVLCALARGHDDEALQKLTQLLPAIERGTMPRLVLDHAALRPLLQRCKLPYAQRLVAQCENVHAARPLPLFGLSRAETQVLQLAMRGLTNEEIAEQLFISRLTVYGHLRKCYQKLGVHSRREAVAAAREAGLKKSDSDSR